MNDDYFSAKVTTAHQAKVAYVYVRQSSLSQVLRHGESTDLQYHLVERAMKLGWPKERVTIIDEDLGKSGASAEQRAGFQTLLAEIGLARVGLVLSLDASRLARNNSDWYQLVELCAHFGTLIADGESLYDPRLYHDRLLLGLSGMMSEAELHNLKLRLHAGEWHKAERGELRLPLPVGLTRLRSGEVVLTPDEEVQSRLRLVFAKFKKLSGARAVVRYFRRHNLLLPSRPLRGPEPWVIVWQPARTSAILGILQNPAYAGTYVYGRRTIDPTRRQRGRSHTGIVKRPLDQWPIVIHQRYPAYITWEAFLANQTQLQANQNRYQAGQPGMPRKGQALLQGIAICGRCGARMRLRYSGPHGNFPVYECHYAHTEQADSPRCQEVRALGVDAEIEQILFQTLEPDKITLALAALAELEQEYALLRQQWQLRLERARYEAERARRQYHMVEPENRLVARTLERAWEEKLRAVVSTEQAYQAWVHQNRLEVTEEDRQDMLTLGANLPALWYAPTTTAADRKQIVRLLIREVLLDQGRERGKVWMQINWQTGATSDHWLVRRVSSYAEYAHVEELQQRIAELAAAEKTDQEMAAMLNEEGFRTAHGFLFSNKIIWLLRHAWGLPAAHASSAEPLRWEDGTYTIQGAASAIGVFPGTIYKWLRTGRLQGHQPTKGAPWKIPLTEEQITSLRNYTERVRRSKKEAS